jgi:hypothetical protein
MTIELKIKQVSLADEAQYIKSQEEKLRKYADRCYEIAAQANDESVSAKYRGYALQHIWKAQELKDHRKAIVADEARNANIARAYIKGKPYRFAESEGYKKENPPNIARIARLIQKYGKTSTGSRYPQNQGYLNDLMETVEAWINV